MRLVSDGWSEGLLQTVQASEGQLLPQVSKVDLSSCLRY